MRQAGDVREDEGRMDGCQHTDGDGHAGVGENVESRTGDEARAEHEDRSRKEFVSH